MLKKLKDNWLIVSLVVAAIYYGYTKGCFDGLLGSTSSSGSNSAEGSNTTIKPATSEAAGIQEAEPDRTRTYNSQESVEAQNRFR